MTAKRFRLPLLVLLLFYLALPGAEGFAQQADFSLTSQRQPVRLSMQSSYQRYVEGTRRLSVLSVPVTAFVPLGRTLSLRLSTSMISVKQQNRLSGLQDARLSLSYARPIPVGSLVFNAGVNVPVGKEGLSPEEFETAALLAQDAYGVRVPMLGQGLNVSPALTWAVPVHEDLVLGLGLAYQYRGGYEPRTDYDERYNPGDEVLLTGGLDYRLSSKAAVSGDVSYTLYGMDTLDEEDYYEAGAKITATLQFLMSFGFDQLRLVGRYRSRAKSSLPEFSGTLVSADQQAIPDQGVVSGSYQMRLSNVVYLTVLAGGRFMGQTSRFQQRAVYELGTVPEFVFASGLRLQPRLVYTQGSFSGIDAGFGLEMRL